MIPRVSPETPRENAGFQDPAAPRAARSAEFGPYDPELQAVIDTWPNLDDATRRTFVDVVRKAKRGARFGMIADGLLSLAGELLARDPRMGGLLSIPVLRDAAGLPSDEFDGSLRELAKSGKIDLYPHDYPATLTEVERASYYRDGEGVYNGLSIR